MNIVQDDEYFTEKKCMFCFNKKPASAYWDYTDSNGHYSEIFICPICALDYLPMFLVDALMVTMKTKEDFNMFRQKIECRFQRAMDVAELK